MSSAGADKWAREKQLGLPSRFSVAASSFSSARKLI